MNAARHSCVPFTFPERSVSPAALRLIMSSNYPVHPGEHLGEFLAELGISQYRLANTIGVSPRRVNEIVHRKRSVTADTARRLGKALGMTPEFWLNLQRMYDLDLARLRVDTSTIQPLVEVGPTLADTEGVQPPL